MSQSRKSSFQESITNVVVGFIIGYATNAIMLPLLGMHPSFGDSVVLTVVFAIISVIRSFSIRRYYNWKDQRASSQKK